MEVDPRPEPTCWLVDGFNVLHAGVLHGRERGRWWGAEARRALLHRLSGFRAAGELWVVFDGPERGPTETQGEPTPAAGPKQPPGRARVVFAPSADAWLLRAVRKASNPSRVTVVTGDRPLADRLRHRGAQIESPRRFLARCRSGSG